MSQITNQQSTEPEPVGFRNQLLGAFKQASEAAKAEEAAAAPVAEEVEEPIGEETAPEPEPEPEPEPQAAAPADQHAKPGPKRGRPSVEDRVEARLRNIQSIQDKKFNDFMAVIQQQNAQIQQLTSALTGTRPLAPQEEEDDLDPQIASAIDKRASKLLDSRGLTSEEAKELKLQREVRKYQSAYSDHAVLQPALMPFINRLSQVKVPMNAEVLAAIHEAAGELLAGLHQAIYGAGQQPPAAQTQVNGKTQPPAQRTDRQLTPDAAAALRSSTASMRQETGANVGADVAPSPGSIREAVLMAMKTVARK